VRLTPVVKWLLALNIGIFLLDYLVLASVYGMRGGDPPILRWGAFSIHSAFSEFRIWEFITFQFIHGSLGHVAFNCIAIFFFGPFMERWWGSMRFLIFYLLCGCGGAAFFSVLASLDVIRNGMESALVGASAGIYGILIGVAMVAPNLRVSLLIPPVTLTMRQLALWLMGIAVVMIVFEIGGNEGGEAGHLGGAIVGYLLMRFPIPGLNPGFPPSVPSATPSVPPKLRPRSDLRVEENPEVDAILDKISHHGFQSLTEAERKVLQKAAEQQNSTR
jgi:membrane associated rhomboid family serine protease